MKVSFVFLGFGDSQAAPVSFYIILDCTLSVAKSHIFTDYECFLFWSHFAFDSIWSQQINSIHFDLLHLPFYFNFTNLAILL